MEEWGNTEECRWGAGGGAAHLTTVCRCRWEVRRGSENCVVRVAWSTKYGLPWGVCRISHPWGSWPSASGSTCTLRCRGSYQVLDPVARCT